MKVDSKGQPVSEGTFGLYEGSISAEVVRVLVDPTEDDADVQRVINKGGYMVDTGPYTGVVCVTPSQFLATHDGDSVVAQDGQNVGVGDKVILKVGSDTQGPTPGKSVTIHSLYPIGTLQGQWCASIEEAKGSAPDRYYGVAWGNIESVVEKAKGVAKGPSATADLGEGWDTPAGKVYVGTVAKLHKDGYEFIATITGSHSNGNEETRTLTVTIEKNLVGSIYKEGSTQMYFTKRVTEIISQPGSINADTDEEEGEETMATESKALSDKKRSEKFGAVTVERTGTQIVLPATMGLRTAIAELQRQAEQEEMDVNIMEFIHGFPLDAAHAFVKALELKYGWVNALPTPGFFGPTPPTMIGIVVDPEGRTVQIPWGQLGIPGISGKLSTGIQQVDGRPVFCIGGKIKQKDKLVVNEIAQLARTYLKENSIYKGMAIRVRFPDTDDSFNPLDHQPKFIPTADVRPEELIFSAGVEKQVRVNIWTPIQSLAAVKAARVPLKRGVLLYGRYGVGKTLLASVTARMAVQAGVTFMDLEDSRQLPQAVQFARMFEGMVVIFAEDIDRCDEGGNRTDAFNEILNTVDGLTSKTDEVLIVYTTNHIERISKAMLRQGRIDKVIHIKEPDSDAAQRLVRLYARHMLSPEEDLAEVGVLLQGFIPAAIREVVEQSKLAAIERGDVHRITAEDLRVTAEGTREHMELLKDTPRDDRSELEKLGDAFGKRAGEAIINIWSGYGADHAYARDESNMDSVDAAVERMTKRKAA